MKLIDTIYINAYVNDCRKINNGNFYVDIPSLPSEPGITHKLYLIKAVIPYNWQTVYSGKDTFTIDATTYTLTHGIPNILDFIEEINTLQSTIVATFNRIANRIYYYNPSLSTVVLSATSPLLGLNGSPLSIPGGTTVAAPALIDMRPSPLIQLRSSLPTAMWEIINTGNTSETRNTSILAVISMGNTPLYSHMIWRGGVDAHYTAEITDQNMMVQFEMLDMDDNPIIPQTPPTFVFSVESYRDDEKQILDTQQEILKLARYDMLLKNQPMLKENINLKQE